MGTWGTAILSNDIYEDIYSDFMDLYDSGLDVPEITKQIIDNNSELIADYHDKHNFWFALGMAQWQCKSLDKEVFDRIKQIITNGDNLKLWEELGAEKKDLKKREIVLDKFLQKLKNAKPKARKRKKKILRDSIFEKGSCLIFKLKNGNYGGAFVLSSEKQTELGLNLIAITTINQKLKPTINDFKKTSILIQKEKFGRNKIIDKERVTWYYAEFYKNYNLGFEVIGQLSVDKSYKIATDYSGASQWNMIQENIEINSKIISKLGTPEKKVKLRKLRKRYWL